MFKIEKNKPIPRKNKYKSYPFKNMEIGDSFFVPLTKDTDKHSLGNNIRSATHPIRRNKKFTTRWIPAENGFRCWRIE